MDTSPRVHFLGTPYASRAACGRQILAWREDAPEHTDDREQVTCLACLKAIGQEEVCRDHDRPRPCLECQAD